MCHVHLISNGPLSREERVEKTLVIKRKYRNPVIQFFDQNEKKFKKNYEGYMKKHPGSKEYPNN
jgi:hypothetical protein